MLLHVESKFHWLHRRSSRTCRIAGYRRPITDLNGGVEDESRGAVEFVGNPNGPVALVELGAVAGVGHVVAVRVVWAAERVPVAGDWGGGGGGGWSARCGGGWPAAGGGGWSASGGGGRAGSTDDVGRPVADVEVVVPQQPGLAGDDGAASVGHVRT